MTDQLWDDEPADKEPDGSEQAYAQAVREAVAELVDGSPWQLIHTADELGEDRLPAPWSYQLQKYVQVSDALDEGDIDTLATLRLIRTLAERGVREGYYTRASGWRIGE